jgi:hypothetical protein
LGPPPRIQEAFAVDSTQTTKRALIVGNVWMTAGSLRRSADHEKILNLYLEKIKAAVTKQAPPKQAEPKK